MNSIIVLQSELSTELTATLVGERAAYAWDIHKLRSGVKIRAGVLGGKRGMAHVISATPQESVLKMELELESRTPLPIDLIVGVCRPQTSKKVLQVGSMLGVLSINFVGSERTEKSYLQSKSLGEEFIVEHSLKALEQIWDTRLPTVSVSQDMRRFLKAWQDEEIGADQRINLVASPGGVLLSDKDISQRILGSDRISLAVGPEAGWSEGDLETLSQAGFVSVGMGERVVRVEVAVTALLSQVMFVRDLLRGN